ncbi:MAG: flagellar biosynthesis protein FlhA [Alphaproteobacteria bacterium]
MVILIMPVPCFIMDVCLAISITFSVMVFMTVLFIHKSIEFSSFPTVLLVSTMLRLSLNVASTRLILSHGHEGTNAAGRVIEAFGHLVIGGSYVIGFIVFTILVIVNFVVITKGSSRIAEVSARFTLDAMPGKQMAIDADLSAGLINEQEAKKRRKEVELESNFYGAMDGAAKFVRGDAIAGVLITLINVVGGIIIGVFQNSMDVSNAAQTYSMLTIGDGLVSQIPALIISTASGLLVSKSGAEGSTNKALFDQLGAYPTALGMSAFLIACLGLFPGIPLAPFFLLSIILAGVAWLITKPTLQDTGKLDSRTGVKQEKSTPTNAQTIAPQITIPPPIDLIRVELGYGLLPFLHKTPDNKPLPDLIRNTKQQFAQDLGVILPSIRLQDNLKFSQFHYEIFVKEWLAGQGDLRPGNYLIMDPQAKSITLEGEKTTDPAFGLPAMWIPESQKEEAQKRHYTIIDPKTVLITHLSEIIKNNISEMFTYADVRKLLDNIEEPYKKLLDDLVPGQITIGGIQRILQNLVEERVSVRDLPTILEGIAEATSFTRNLSLITERIRKRLSRQITFFHLDKNNVLRIAILSARWEKAFTDSLVGEEDTKQLAMSPEMIQDFLKDVRQFYSKIPQTDIHPVLVTTAQIRPFVRSVLERARPSSIILSQSEIFPKVKIKTIGHV